jgi:hypothetical protein
MVEAQRPLCSPLFDYESVVMVEAQQQTRVIAPAMSWSSAGLGQLAVDAF